ncbi:MAG: hypothetical protein AAFR87_16940 [Bacteroidota bacterium]
MKTLRTLISAICMIFGQEEQTVSTQSPVFHQACVISIPFTIDELASYPLTVFQPTNSFYTGEEKSFTKENTIVSFEKGHFYLANGFWNCLKKEAIEKEELIYIAQKD